MKHHPHNKERLPEYLQGLIEGKYTLRQVAMWTRYTREHLCRLKKRYKKEGPSCLVNGHKGKPGPRAIPQEVKAKIVNIYRRDFVAGGVGTNFACFRDCLKELYGISYSYRAIYDMLTAAGIESPEKRKNGRKRAHRPRQRRAAEGEMLQADASSFEWLRMQGDMRRYSLHGMIDDATNQITALCLAKTECSLAYYAVLEETIEKRGLPEAIYSDRAAIFCGNPKEGGPRGREKRGQFPRVLFELEIGQVLARSPQAKGRVERLWRTLQGRLPVAFKLGGVTTIEEANRFLREKFVPAFNAKFAVESKKPPVWRQPREGWREKICSRIWRKADGAGVVSCMGHKLLVKANCARRRVELCVYSNAIRALYKGRYYEVELVEGPRRKSHAPLAAREIIEGTLGREGRQAKAPPP